VELDFENVGNQIMSVHRDGSPQISRPPEVGWYGENGHPGLRNDHGAIPHIRENEPDPAAQLSGDCQA
jgi:hypothetical protein